VVICKILHQEDVIHAKILHQHRHDGGTKMIMMVNGKEVCESKAVYGKAAANNDEAVVDMTLCDKSVPLKRGDELTLKAEYDLKSHPLYV
jgi:Stress up-regulated Nod 19